MSQKWQHVLGSGPYKNRKRTGQGKELEKNKVLRQTFLKDVAAIYKYDTASGLCCNK
jgi:hypothetical protein